MVSKYHSPRMAVIIPHYNYSEFLEDALLSVQQQTYENFTCVIVDDCSTGDDYPNALELVAKLGDKRFSIVRNSENRGMVHSIYNGIDQIDAAFVSILDPDDRYAPTFLAKMLAVHLSPAIYCPLVCCDQFLLRVGDGIISSTQYDNGTPVFDPDRTEREQINFERTGFHRYVRPTENGWPWATTSSMLFRTDALKLIRPTKKLAYVGQGDAYCANGAHMMGGSILLSEPLVYRGLHQKNDFISESVFSIFRPQAKPGSEFLSDVVKIDVIEAFLNNGGLETFSINNFRDVIYAQFLGTHLSDLISAVPLVKELLLDKPST